MDSDWTVAGKKKLTSKNIFQSLDPDYEDNENNESNQETIKPKVEPKKNKTKVNQAKVNQTKVNQTVIETKSSPVTKTEPTKPVVEPVKNTPLVIDKEQQQQQQQEQENKLITGENIKLHTAFDLWVHDIYTKEWDINSYKKICTVTNVSEFWRLLNNMDNLGLKVNNFYLMKTGTDPTWEHINNRNGGVCSFRVNMSQTLTVFEDLCVHLACGKLNFDDNDLTGISITPKNSWSLIKIWNKDKRYDLTITLNKDIMIKYHDLSIKYKANEPEY